MGDLGPWELTDTVWQELHGGIRVLGRQVLGRVSGIGVGEEGCRNGRIQSEERFGVHGGQPEPT